MRQETLKSTLFLKGWPQVVVVFFKYYTVKRKINTFIQQRSSNDLECFKDFCFK